MSTSGGDDITRPIKKARTTQYTFIIPGRAFSALGRSASRYKAEIATIAAQNINQRFTQDELHVKVDYFYNGKNRVDGDNLLKNVLDGLKGVVYSDDAQVTHAEACLHNTTLSFTIEEPASPEIFDWLSKGQEFVAVLVRIRPRLIVKSRIRRTKNGKEN